MIHNICFDYLLLISNSSTPTLKVVLAILSMTRTFVCPLPFSSFKPHPCPLIGWNTVVVWYAGRLIQRIC